MADEILEKLQARSARIKVIGVGGAGVNAVNNMIRSGLQGVEFYAANTDAQALLSSAAKNRIPLGDEVTKGLGAGADPDVGYAAAKESEPMIRAALDGADMVFVTAGQGGGTGTLASTVIAQIAKDQGALTVGVVTKPFLFEGKRRMKNAERGIEELKKHVDTLITIPNQRLLSVAGRNTTLLDTFRKADDILYQAVKGISDLIIFEGLVNVDFADVRAVMSEMGLAMMGTGEASGDNRAVEAAEKAITSPLLEDISIHGARGVLMNITASPDVTLQEVNEAAELIHGEAHEDANIIWGMVIDPHLEDRVRVTVIATGFGDRAAEGDTTVSMASVVSNKESALSAVTDRLEVPAFARKAKEGPVGEVIKLKKLSVLSSSEDEEKYEIPTFLRKQVD
ncbi:MAG: cell division protein FtsZ [Proteobacteria bacterium]|nr:cell division protein FtsZ [Pseudomonadota bacterium]